MGEIVEKFLSLTEQEQKDLLNETQIIDENYADYVKDMIEGIRTKIIWKRSLIMYDQYLCLSY